MAYAKVRSSLSASRRNLSLGDRATHGYEGMWPRDEDGRAFSPSHHHPRHSAFLKTLTCVESDITVETYGEEFCYTCECVG